MCAFALREFGTTVTASERAIAAYREAGDLTEVARANNIAGHALATLGRVAEAKGLIEEAMTIARVLETPVSLRGRYGVSLTPTPGWRRRSARNLFSGSASGVSQLVYQRRSCLCDQRSR